MLLNASFFHNPKTHMIILPVLKSLLYFPVNLVILNQTSLNDLTLEIIATP